MRMLTPPLIFAVVAATTLPVQAQDSMTLRREIEAALVRASESGSINDAGGVSRITSHGGVRYELGAVVDVRTPRGQGLPILAVTPGSTAARLGLRAGDRLLAINGRSIGAGKDPQLALQQAMNAGNGKVNVQWLRGGARLAANERADAVAIPAYQLIVGARNAGGCGFVSDRQGVIPKSQGIFQAEITRIDGRSTPLAGKYEYELPVGTHVLTVAEHIDRARLSMQQSRQIQISHRTKTAAQSYKTLVVEVKPNTTYRVGVRLNKDALDNDSIRRNAYWEPVVWESKPQACR